MAVMEFSRTKLTGKEPLLFPSGALNLSTEVLAAASGAIWRGEKAMDGRGTLYVTWIPRRVPTAPLLTHI